MCDVQWGGVPYSQAQSAVQRIPSGKKLDWPGGGRERWWRMISRRNALFPGAGFLKWFAVPALVMAFVIWDAIVRDRHIVDLSANYGVTVDAPLQDVQSLTGYEGGRRSMLLPEAGEDTAHWVMQTQAMIADGEARVRNVAYDNAPRGREVHWASPVHWGLAALAWIDHLATGRPMGLAVEWATLTFGVVGFGVMLLGLMPLLHRKFSAAAATVFAIGAVATFPFYTDFLPGRTDHHGVANLCGLVTVLLLAAAMARVTGDSAVKSIEAKETNAREIRDARRWIIGSAVAGGCGLWISAATQVPVLIGIGLGVFAATWLGRASPSRLIWIRDPNLWRIWGCVGGGVSLMAYLIEYFPSQMGFRLEVNHPCYAAAWIGAGEVLRVATMAISGEKRALTRRELATGGIGLGLVVLLPVLIFFTGDKTFTVADPFIWRIHTRYISEFQGLARLFATKGWSWGSVALCLPMLLLVPPILTMFRRSAAIEVKGQVALTLGPAAVGCLMAWGQLRWLGLAYALSIPVVAVFFRAAEEPPGNKGKSRGAWLLGCLLLFLPGAVGAVQRTLAGADFTKEELRHLAERDVAHWLRLRAGTAPVAVAGAPSTTTALISLGGLSGLGTLYWENAEGLKHAGALFGATSPEEARALARSLGVTHIVLFSWDAFEAVLAKEYRGLPQNAPIPPDMFVANLLSSPVPPPWLRAIPFKLPDNPALAGEQVRIWEVTADQPPAEAVAHAANYYLELGVPSIAERLAPELGKFNDTLISSVMLAGIASRRHDSTAFASAFERVVAQISQADRLSLDDRVHLVVVLAVGRQENLARGQLMEGMRKADEQSVRHLTPGTLSDLLALCEALNVEWPNPALKQLAVKLVPPAKRK